MSLENLISHAFTQPTTLISYHVSQQLTARYPDKYILYADSCAFDLAQFVKAQHCQAAPNPDVLNQIETAFEGADEELGHSAVNGIYDIVWQDKTLQAVFMTWRDEYTNQYCWLVTDSQAIAKDFYFQVCAWAAEVRGEMRRKLDAMQNNENRYFHAVLGPRNAAQMRELSGTRTA